MTILHSAEHNIPASGSGDSFVLDQAAANPDACLLTTTHAVTVQGPNGPMTVRQYDPVPGVTLQVSGDGTMAHLDAPAGFSGRVVIAE